jgi:hypothetical protein
MEDAHQFAASLARHGYAPLLGPNPDQALVESINREPDIARRLAAIINNRDLAWQARFIASEFLFRRVDMVLQSGCDRGSLVESYFQALRHNYTGNGVDWGFGQSASDIGVLSRMVIGWGREVDAFKPGLDDDAVVTMMNFFERTPPHFRPPYRVKDFAALIIAKAHSVAIDLSGSPEVRDRAVAELKKIIAAKN